MTARIVWTSAMTICFLTAFSMTIGQGHAENARPASSQAMVDAAQHAFVQSRALFESSQGSLEETYLWSVRWKEALVRNQPTSARLAAQAHLARMRDVCDVARRMVGQGMLDPTANHACTYYLAEAQLWVSQAH